MFFHKTAVLFDIENKSNGSLLPFFFIFGKLHTKVHSFYEIKEIYSTLIFHKKGMNYLKGLPLQLKIK